MKLYNTYDKLHNEEREYYIRDANLYSFLFYSLDKLV